MQTLGRALLITIFSVLLVGFGLCGAYGAFAGLSVSVSGGFAFGIMFVVAGAAGLGIAWLCWKAIASIWRKPGPPAE
jgi:hypothetical protein